MHQSINKIQRNVTKRQANSVSKSSKPKIVNMSNSMIHNNKETYVKKFFQRRYQIQMQVRKRVFEEAKEQQKTNKTHQRNSSWDLKGRHLKIQQKQRTQKKEFVNQRKSHKSGRSKKASKSKQNSKNQFAQNQEVEGKHNLFSSWEMTTKTTKQASNSNKKDNKFNFHLDLKPLLQQKSKQYKFYRDPCSDKRIHKQQKISNEYFNKLNKNIVNPQNQQYRHRKQNEEYVYDPKKYKYLSKQVNSIQKDENRRYNNKCNSKQANTVNNKVEEKESSDYWPLSSIRHRMEQQSYRGRSNGFKYQINQQFRQKLASMLAKQRSATANRMKKSALLQYSMKNSSKIRNVNESSYAKIEDHHHYFYEQCQKQESNKQIMKISPQFSQSIQLCQTPKRQQKSSLLTELLSQLIQKQKPEKLNRKNEKLTIANQYNELIMSPSLPTGNEHIQEYRTQNKEREQFSIVQKKREIQTIQRQQYLQQQSEIICAICQTNITNKLWKYAIFYSKRQEEEYFNFHQLFVEGAMDQPSLEYRDEEVPLLLDCGHSYHKTCLEEWFKYKTVCPLCKSAPHDNNQQEYEISISNDESYYDDSYTIEEEEYIYSNNIYGMDYSDRFIPLRDYYRASDNGINIRINTNLNIIQSEMEVQSQLPSIQYGNHTHSGINDVSMPISQTSSRVQHPYDQHNEQISLSLAEGQGEEEVEGSEEVSILSEIINQFSIQDVRNKNKQHFLFEEEDEEYEDEEDDNYEDVFTSSIDINFQQSF